MYCQKCGKEVNDEAVVCIHCGCTIQNQNVQHTEQDAPNKGIFVLGFFIPIIGLIMYLVWHSSLPQKAKSAGKGALIGFCTWIGLSIVSSIISMVLAFSSISHLINSML